MPKVIVIAGIGAVALLALIFVLRQAAPPRSDILTVGADTAEARQFEIVTLLGFDAIPAINNPGFVDATVGNEQLRADDLVIGVEIEGEARAYGVAFLSSHEIVNDVVGGRPIAVTW